MSKLPFPERRGHPPDDALAAIRLAIDNARTSGALSTQPPSRETMISGVRCLSFTPSSAVRGTVIHFHGGGYRIGCPELSAQFARLLADTCAVEVVCPAYRLAPENPYPAGLNDGWAVWTALAQDAELPVILSGDSAGGGLAASLASCGHLERFRLDGLILLSPWLDLAVVNDSYGRNARSDSLFSREQAVEAAGLYLQDISADLPTVSPINASLAHIPATLISVGDGEVLLDDALRFHAALQRAGVAATLNCVRDMTHVAVTRGMAETGATESFDVVSRFVGQIVATTAPTPLKATSGRR